MAKKFSGFSTSIVPDKTSTSQFIVGYSGQDNAQWTMKALADEIGGGDSIYTASSTIQSDRLVTFPTSGTLSFRVKNATDSKFNIGYEGGYGSISINPAKPIVGSVHRIEAAGVAMLSKYTAGNTLWFGNESNTNNSYGFNMGAAPNAQSSTVVTIKGQGLTGSTTALKVQNSDGDDIVKVIDDGQIKLGTTTGSNNLLNQEPLQINSASGSITNYIRKSGGTWRILNFTGGEPYMTVSGTAAANVTFGTGQVLISSTSGVHYKYGGSASAPAFSGLSVSDNSASSAYPAKAFQNARINSTRITDKITNNGIGAASGGLQVFNTTTKKLQYWDESAWVELGGGDNIYTADGTIASTTRTITTTGTSNIIWNLSGNSRFYINSLYVLPTGRIFTPSGGGFTINSFGTSLVGGNLALYSGTHLTGSNSSGYLTVSGTANTADISARVGIIGKGNTNATYGLRVQNVDEIDTFSVDDTGLVSVTGDTANSRLGLRFIPSNSAAGTGQYCKIQDTNGNDWIQKYQGAVSSNRSNILFVGKANGYASENNIVINGPGNVGAPSDNQTNIGDSSLWVWQGANIYGQYITGKTQDSTSTALLVRNWNGNAGVPSFDTYFQLRNDKRLIYNDGNEAVGKVLTCDANGVATWQTAGGGDNIYTADGTLSGNRIVTLGNNTLSFTTAGNGAVKLDSPVSVSRNPSLSVSMYIQGQGATSSTRSLLLENSNGAYMMSVKDDGQITIGSGATIQSNSNPQYSVVMGYGAKDIASVGNAAESVAIGRLATGNGGSVAIGGQAKGLGSSSVAVGAQAQAAATGTSVGYQAGGASAGSSAVSIGKFAQAQANGSIAIGANTGLTGANSIVLNATTGVTASTAADTFEIFMTSTSTPDFTIKGTTGGNQAKVVGQVSVGLKSSAAIDGINWDEGNIQEVTLASGANDFDPINEVPGSTYILKITQPSSADGTIDWESTTATVNWPGG
ncbi:MAG: beta strand repeat-containing protein, partial [Planctomycetota bacterium]